MNEQDSLSTGMAQEAFPQGKNVFIQILLGLILGGGILAVGFGFTLRLHQQRQDEKKELTALSSNPTATPSGLESTPTMSPTGTETPGLTDSPTPTLAPLTSAATGQAQLVSSISSPNQVDLSLPPFPLLSGSEEDNQQEKVPDTPFPNATHLIQATGKPQPDSTFIPTLIATPVKPTRVPTVAVAQTAALEQEASLAQALAQKAQEQAEQQEAVRHAPTLYQQGLEQFTQGLESFDKGLFRTATKHFQEAAKAFVESGSTVQRLQVTRETKLNTQNLLTEARNQVALRAFAQADQLYLAYLEKNPQDSSTALEYGELVMDHLDYSRGAQFLAKLVSKPGLQPVQRARVHARFAEGFFRAGNITTAIQEIRAALQDDPQNQTYRSQLNQYQYANSEKQQAQQKRQGYQQRVLSDLTGSVIDSLVH